MMTPEEIELAARQLFYLQMTPEPETTLRQRLLQASQSAQNKNTMWSRIWQHYNVKEQDIISLYRKQQKTFQQFHDMMQQRINAGRPVTAVEKEIIGEMNHLLQTNDLVLNSSHVVLILRTMKLFKVKKKESANHGTTTSFRHGFHLTVLFQLWDLLTSTTTKPEAAHQTMKQASVELKAWGDKYKVLLDEVQLGRVHVTLNMVSMLLLRTTSADSMETYMEVGDDWGFEFLPIVEDMIEVEYSSLKEKLVDDFKVQQALGLELFVPEKRKLIEDFLRHLQKKADVNETSISLEIPRYSVDCQALERWLGSIEFAGIVDDVDEA